MNKLFASIPLSLALGLTLATTAIATTGQIYREPNGAVTVYGLEPDSRIRFGVNNPARQLTSNDCGLLRVTVTRTYPSAPVTVNGVTYYPATLPRQILPSCRKRGAGYSLDEDRPTAFVSSDNGALIIPGLPANTRLTVTYPGSYRVMARRVNGCGFLRIRETETIKLGETMLLPTGGRSVAEFRLSELPMLNGLICFRDHVYRPVPWAGWPTVEAIPGSEIADLGDSAVATSPSGALGGDGGSGGSGGGSSGGGGGSGGDGDGSGGDDPRTGDDTGTGNDDSGSGTGNSSGGNDTGTGEGSGDSGSGSSPDPAMYDFTDATYNASIHDYNGDGLVDDSTGDGIPDDRDGDGFPDGLWGPNDLPRSAGPGFTLPLGTDFCYGYDGSLVYFGSAGQTYYLDADNGLYRATGSNNFAVATANATTRMVRFQGTFTDPPFSHEREGSDRNGYLSRNEDFDRYSVFQWRDIDSCLIPPWLSP